MSGDRSDRGKSGKSANSGKSGAPVCAICGKEIEGKYLRDFWGNDYHYGHRNSHPACDYCGRLMSRRSSDGAFSFDDGRKICGLCKADAVEEKETGLRILYEARDLLEKAGIVLRPFNPSFSLLDRNTLKKYSKSGEEQGFTHAAKKSDGAGNILELKIRVFVLHGLPYEAFLATAAHELMHAWIHLNGRNDAKKWLKEGSCNMAAFLALRQKRSLKAEYQIRQMQEQRDRVYGKGFRKVRRFVQRRGTKSWLRVLRTKRSLPLF
jgi:hypothetical protein